MVRTGVSAIDTGQTEAAYALGVRKNKTFFKIVLPQAMPFILPQYKGELVSLIKATAIVGYIAVEDLTRMGDLIRSRTYEAFFPLIAVAAIYFLMARILIIAVGRIEIRIDPKRRKKRDILKGVNVHD
jgi:polar amino acid transport system substrate-binding protein